MAHKTIALTTELRGLSHIFAKSWPRSAKPAEQARWAGSNEGKIKRIVGMSLWKQMSAVGFEPMRTCMQWISSPPTPLTTRRAN